MRNNEERTGIADKNTGAESPPTPPPNVQQSANPLLNFVAPTEFVEIPSQGKFYVEGHPLHNVSVVEIKHMTTKEEDILTSESLLRQGKTLDRFLKQIIVDSRINPDEMLIGDKNALLVSARISGYGSSYNTEVTCPRCATSTEYEFDLSTAFKNNALEENPDDVEATESGTFIIKNLPVSEWSVEVKPLTGVDEKKIQKAMETKRKQKLPEDMLTTQMSAYVVSISGVRDRILITEAIGKMPARDSRYLRTKYLSIIPSIEMSQMFSCSECDYSEELEVPFTTDFFWPKQ